MSGCVLTAKPLTRDAFQPFGDVIDTSNGHDMIINAGRCERFHDLAELAYDGGKAGISLFKTKSSAQPVTVDVMERHPLGSQAFIPMSSAPFLVVVAEDDGGKPGTMHTFLTVPYQGVNYAANVWHAPLLALEDDAMFAVIDRIGEGENLEEVMLDTPIVIEF